MSPTLMQQPEPQSQHRSGLIVALVVGCLLAMVAANVYLYVQLDHLRTDVAKFHESVNTSLSNLRDASTVTTAAQMRHIETLKEELETARNQARTMSSQAKAEAIARSEQLAKQIQAEEAKVQQQNTAEINAAKQSASDANTKIADVSSDVGNVKKDLSSTNADLQKTIADLKSTRGDLGVQSGLIATNANELAALKRLGERNYIDIKLGKTKQPQRYGDITLMLKKVDPKKNTYTVDVMVDDTRTEKKDRNINEPVQFYTTKGGRIPYEMVINKVQKDMIVGYLSTPKVEATR